MAAALTDAKILGLKAPLSGQVEHSVLWFLACDCGLERRA